MKLTKKIPKNRAFDADSPKATQDFKLSIFVCITLHDRKRLQMEGTAKEIWKVAHNLYEIQQVVKKWDDKENF